MSPKSRPPTPAFITVLVGGWGWGSLECRQTEDGWMQMEMMEVCKHPAMSSNRWIVWWPAVCGVNK